MYAPFSPAMARVNRNKLRIYLSEGSLDADMVQDETTWVATAAWVGDGNFPLGARELVTQLRLTARDDAQKIVVQRAMPRDPADPAGYIFRLPTLPDGSYSYVVDWPGATVTYGPDPSDGDFIQEPPEPPEEPEP